MGMKTITAIYGGDTRLTFQVRTKLPKFKYGCDARTRLVHRHFKRKKVPSPMHDYRDYLVESVEVYDSGEIWHLGS